MNLSTVGKRIKRIRQEKGFTQEELARKMGICRLSLINLEKGKQMPKWDKMLKLQKVLKTDLS